MASIKKFEDLIAWQKARELTKNIYRICRPKDMSKFRNVDIFQADMSRDRGLCDQIQRASVSIMSNIAEGFERGTKHELINYFYIAKGSCAEVRCQLYVTMDAGYIDMSTFRNLYGLADEVGRLIESFVQKVKAGAMAGLQYRHVDMSKFRKMPEHIKMLLEKNPEWREYYNEEKKEMEFWRMAEDKKKKEEQKI